MSLGLEDMEAFAAHWDPASLETHLDAQALEEWPPAGRENLMHILRPLGPYLGPDDDDARVFADYDPAKGGWFIHGECLETARCKEGRATFQFTMTRPVSGPWRVVNFNVRNIEFYKPPESATPTASPVP